MVQQYFDESHNILRQSVRKFLEREVLPFIDEWEDKEEFPRELYKKAAEAGFLGLHCPEDLGGTPADVFHTIAFTEEFLRSTTTTTEAVALSKDLKQRGWRFFGPTTAYAFMQATGLVNDHTEDCITRRRVEEARESFARPT